MAKAKKPKSTMFVELNRVLDQVAKDKGIPKEILVDAIEQAFLSAARKKWGHLGELEAHFNEEDGEIELFQFKTAVATVEDPNIQMVLPEARKLDPEAQEGDSIGVKMDPAVFGRIAAQAAKQVIIQKVRDAERNIVFAEYKDRVGELVTGIVRRYEKGDLIVDLGKAEAVIPRQEQVPTEHYKVGDRIQTYFLELNPDRSGSMLVLSRRHSNLVKQLFAVEVPEIAEGIVQLKGCAREPGVRAKIAVASDDSDVDPVGACVGMKGSRVQSVVQELKGEKIDIVAWDSDAARFVCNAIAPAEVAKVIIKEREHVMEVIVPDDQLSLAIGRKGQNVRLAAQLVGWNIDVFSEAKIEELASRTKIVLAKVLETEDSNAILLYTHGFRAFEDIAHADWENLKKVPGIGEENLKKLQEKAKAAVAKGVTSAQLTAEIFKPMEVPAAEKPASETQASEAPTAETPTVEPKV